MELGTVKQRMCKNSPAGLLLILVSCAGFWVITAPIHAQRAAEPVVFPDPMLENAIRGALNKPEGDILDTDLLSLTILDAPAMGIVNLAGLERCTELRVLHIEGNAISFLDPVSALHHLLELNISANPVSMLAPLGGLFDLQVLRSSNCQIVDLAPLSTLHNLEVLALQGNLIESITPLTLNAGLLLGDTIDLRANPLNNAALCLEIPLLQVRGVVVTFDGHCGDEGETEGITTEGEGMPEGESEGEGEETPVLEPDAYEPDNTPAEATWIGIDGAYQRHNFHHPADVDWVRFYVLPGQEITVQTLDLAPNCDTFLELYRDGEVTPFLVNDNIAIDLLNSLLSFLAVEPFMCFAKVSASGKVDEKAEHDTQYTMSVTQTGGPMSATLYCAVEDADNDNEPILDASVTLLPLNITVKDNVDGIYSFIAVPAGNYTLDVSAPGYLGYTEPVLLFAGQTKTVEVLMHQESTEEGEGVIEGEGFAEGEGAIEGEGLAEGEGAPEGEGLPDEGEMEGIAPEGEGLPDEGEMEGIAPEGEGLPEEGEMEGIAPEGEGLIEGEGLWEGEGEGVPEGQAEGLLEGEGLGEGEGEIIHHTADQNGDNRISLSELLRIIQLYNSDGYHCDAGTEDGFAPDAGSHACTPHASDYNPPNWDISLSELLRAIQFYNSPSFHYCPGEGTEDGFCPD